MKETAASMETLLVHQLPDIAGSIATPIVMLIMLFVFDWRFGLACLVLFVFGFAAMFKMAGPSIIANCTNKTAI